MMCWDVLIMIWHIMINLRVDVEYSTMEGHEYSNSLSSQSLAIREVAYKSIYLLKIIPPLYYLLSCMDAY